MQHIRTQSSVQIFQQKPQRNTKKIHDNNLKGSGTQVTHEYLEDKNIEWCKMGRNLRVERNANISAFMDLGYYKKGGIQIIKKKVLPF